MTGPAMTRTARAAAAATAATALAVGALIGAATPAAAATKWGSCIARTPLDPTRPDYVHVVKVTYTDKGGPGSDVTSIRVNPEIRADVSWTAFKDNPLRIVGRRNKTSVAGGRYTSVGAPPARAFTEHLNVWFTSNVPGPDPNCWVKVRLP